MHYTVTIYTFGRLFVTKIKCVYKCHYKVHIENFRDNNLENLRQAEVI